MAESRAGGQAMNERDGTLKFHWSEYAKFREWFATTKWFDDPVYCEIADAAWQAALSAAAPNNGTYCIHGIKCALCADGIAACRRETAGACHRSDLSIEISPPTHESRNQPMPPTVGGIEGGEKG